MLEVRGNARRKMRDAEGEGDHAGGARGCAEEDERQRCAGCAEEEEETPEEGVAFEEAGPRGKPNPNPRRMALIPC